MEGRNRLRWLPGAALLAALAVPAALAQPSPATAPAAEELIALDFPENVELKLLIEYVSQRLGLNILFDEQTVNHRVTVKSPAPVPPSALLGLLQSTLSMKGLALSDADQPGWKRVVKVESLTALSGPATRQAGEADPTAVITQVFSFAHVDPARAEVAVRPFLTQPGGNSLSFPEQRLLVVTDYGSTVQKVAKLIALIDQAQRSIVTRFVDLRHVQAQQIAQEVNQLVSTHNRLVGEAAAQDPVELGVLERTNQIVLAGSEERVNKTEELIRSLDTPLTLQTKIYSFLAADPERIDRLAKELVGAGQGGQNERVYQSAVDKESRSLVVTAPPEVHAKVESLKADLDKPLPVRQDPVRFHKLANATASEVLGTIRALEGTEGLTAVKLDGAEAVPLPPLPPVPADAAASAPAPAAASGPVTVRTRTATVTADPTTNSIIVVAPEPVQAVYERLIKSLDKRRPQVLVEATIVALDTSDNFSLGVEIGSRAGGGDTQIINFTSFGIGRADPQTGQIALRPGLGFNGTILDSDVASLVLRALSTSSRAHVVASPRVLVNDNATGTLSSVAESPFTSVNASDTVATTSFAGYAQAGTEITVTPHIAEGDHLVLEYQVSLNNFTGEGGEGIPPPRQTDAVRSVVTVPDGGTIIVGGLSRTNRSQSVSTVPLLGQLPVLEWLLGNRTHSESRTSLFVFLRPVILRDDQFADLKYYSRRDVKLAGLKGDLPQSEPMLIE